MSTRVTENLLYSKSQAAMGTSRERMVASQEQAVSGKRVNRPSDDPAAVGRILSLKQDQKVGDQILQNMDIASNYVNMTDSSLGELTEVLNRAKELGLQMSSSTNDDPGSQKAVAQEVNQLMLRAVQIGNTRVGDKYIFGGYNTDRAPFDENGNYFGDSGEIELEVAPGQRLAINLPGSAAFFGMKDISPEAKEMRMDPEQNKVPSVEGALRGPASVSEEPQTDATHPMAQTENIFDALKGFQKSLEAGDMAQIHASLDRLDVGQRQVIAMRAQIGGRQNSLDATRRTLEGSVDSAKALTSKIEDADVMTAYSDISKNQTALQASMEINKKLLSGSLLDFLK